MDLINTLLINFRQKMEVKSERFFMTDKIKWRETYPNEEFNLTVDIK